VKTHIKALLESRAPPIANICRAIQQRRFFGRHFRPLHERARKALYGANPIQVLSGPFQGLRYIDAIVWGPITPKWLGSYEIELGPVIEEIVGRGYESILDIGCAEGYYAVGLAYRSPRARVYAYDTAFLSRRQTRRLARLNSLENRVAVLRYCGSREIARRVSGRSLVFCDIEGFERTLLDPAACPSLMRVDILVEIHEGSWPQSTLELLHGRFDATHAIVEVAATDRNAWIQAILQTDTLPIGREQLREAADEHRTNGFKWLWMKARVPNPTPESTPSPTADRAGAHHAPRQGAAHR